MIREPGGDPISGMSIVTSANALVIEEGQSQLLSVHLSESPASPVVVTVSVVGGGGGFSIESGTQLSFDGTNWDVDQQVTLRSATDEDTANNWGRIELRLPDGVSTIVDLTQDDTEGTPVPTSGVTLKVKDVSGQGAVDYPVHAVIPLPYGSFQDTSGFRMVDPFGNAIPAQFEILNRWWARDGSLRHVVAHFEASVAPNGVAGYAFETDGDAPSPEKPIQLTETGGVVTVDTGAIRFTVKRQGFNLFDEVWLDANGDGTYADAEKIVSSSADHGPVFSGRLANDIQRPGTRGDLTLEVEEAGPMRAVIKVGGLTVFNATDDHTHGFAVRIYAYAGKPYVKVDYQLQNSAKNAFRSWPLYLEDLSLELKPNLSSPTVRLATGPEEVWSGSIGNGRYLYQNSDSSSAVRDSSSNSVLLSGTNSTGLPSYGWADISDSERGVFVSVRHMAEMWPNGFEVESDGTLAVRLWPKWGSQHHNGQTSASGLYWLEDMQHVYKEVLYFFHGKDASDRDLSDLARNFQYRPLPIVPTHWYYQTRVTLDLDGIMPSPDPVTTSSDTKRPKWLKAQLDPNDGEYAFGWRNFGGDTGRKGGGSAGGWPRSAANAIASERIDYFLLGETRVFDQINCRPQSMAGYTHAEDWDFLQLQHNFSSNVWRGDFDWTKGQGGNLAADYLSGTGFGGWEIRDNQHFWSYREEEVYLLNANPWVRDWFEFVGQFRLAERAAENHDVHWIQANTFSDNVRGEAHSWASLLQAYRVTGDPDLLAQIKKRFRKSVLPAWSKQYGNFNLTQEAAFQIGFFARQMVSLLTEIRGSDPQLEAEVFNVLWGIVDWTHNLSNFDYYIDSTTADPGSTQSNGTAVTMVAPFGWFALTTGNSAMLEKLRAYITTGVNGGEASYGGPANWSYGFNSRGGFVGRIGETVMNTGVVPSAPAAITDLQASAAGGGVKIQWTTPAGAARFHVLWGTKPFTTTYDRSGAKLNPWGGTPVGTSLEASSGEQQELTFTGPASGQTIYVVVYTFAEGGALSAISNTATITLP